MRSSDFFEGAHNSHRGKNFSSDCFTERLPYGMRQQSHARTRSNRIPTQILDTEVIVRIPVIVNLLTEAECCRDSDCAGQSGTMVCVRSL